MGGRDALALLDYLNAGPAVILGNSFAAGSALWAAHDAPARVNGVVLLGPIVRDQKLPWFAKLALNVGFAGPWRVWFLDHLLNASRSTQRGLAKTKSTSFSLRIERRLLTHSRQTALL